MNLRGSDRGALTGSTMKLQLSLHPGPFHSWQLLEAWESSLTAPAAGATVGCRSDPPDDSPASGSGQVAVGGSDSGPAAATALFIGRVRGRTAAGLPLEALELEHYPGMTEAQLEALARSCGARHGATALLVAHRVGRVLPGEAIVLVAAAADRRGPAQRCCMALLEALKHEAPFWKREWSGGRGAWVQGNTRL